jgi:hypothetical protein
MVSKSKKEQKEETLTEKMKRIKGASLLCVYIRGQDEKFLA